MSYRKSSDQINRPMFSARRPARAPRGGNGGTANMTLPPAFLKQKAEGPPSLSPTSIPPGHRVWLTQWQPPTSLCFSPHLVMALRIFHPQCFISCLTALPACLPAPSRPHPVKPPVTPEVKVSLRGTALLSLLPALPSGAHLTHGPTPNGRPLRGCQAPPSSLTVSPAGRRCVRLVCSSVSGNMMFLQHTPPEQIDKPV